MKKLILSTLFLVCFYAITTYAANNNFESGTYGSNNHIFNYSHKPWTFNFSFLSGGVNNINDVNKYSHIFSIAVDPNQTVPIYYRRSYEGSEMPGGGPVYEMNGKVIITDFEGKSQCYTIQETFSNAPWIYSNGTVFPVILLNNSAGQRKYGDITIMMDSWSSAPAGSSFGPKC